MNLFLTGNDSFSKLFSQSKPIAGQSVKLSVLQKLENGMYLIDMRGKNYQVNLPQDTTPGQYRATVQKNDAGEKTLSLEPLKSDSSAEQSRSDIKPGQQVDVKVIRLIRNGLYLIDLKGKQIEASIKDLPATSSFKAEVIKGGDSLELKPLPVPVNQLSSQQLKQELVTFDKSAILDVLKSSGKFNIDQITPAAIQKVMKESGNFFENKLLNNIQVGDDNKFHAIKTDNTDLKDSIQKVQLVNTLLNNAAFSFFTMTGGDIKSGEMFISKQKDQFSVHLKIDFTEIGETLIKIVARESHVDVVVSSEKDISEQLSQLDIPGMNIHWKKISEQDRKSFDLSLLIMEKLGTFEIIA